MKFKEYAQSLNLSMYQFAKKLGINDSRLSHLSTGKETLSMRTAIRWAKKLNCKVADIWDAQEYEDFYRIKNNVQK